VNYAFIDNVGANPFLSNSIDFTETGVYTIRLTAFQGVNQIASTAINVAAVPEAGAFLLFSVALVSSGGVYALRRFRKVA
jgi:hypothetical protein